MKLWSCWLCCVCLLLLSAPWKTVKPMSDEVCRCCTVTKFHGIPDTSNCQIHATPPPTVPRLARSVDDLRVGMTIASKFKPEVGDGNLGWLLDPGLPWFSMDADDAEEMRDWWNSKEVVVILADAPDQREDDPISADHLRKAVLQWASRFQPGDRWDTEDVRDLEAALGGTVENRCHHRSSDAARDLLVPATQMEALREAIESPRWLPLATIDAASAVLDAAREVEHE